MNTSKPDMQQMLTIIDEWKKTNPVLKNVVVFQNKKLLANIRFDDHSIHSIGQINRGFENIPQALKYPNEVWSYWEDPDKQTKVIRNYILFGVNNNFVAQTKDGHVEKISMAFNSELNKYRKGVKIV